MVVIDNCALIEITRQTDLGKALIQLMLRNERVLAPDLIVYEATSVGRKLAKTEKLSIEDTARVCSKALELIDDFVPAIELHEEALRESVRLDHSSYDMFYFVLARRTGATLLTTDSKLAALCEANGVNCTATIDF